MSNERLHGRPGDGAWSANDILAHLRACADVWGKGIHRMLVEESPAWRYVSPRTWIRKTNYLEQGFPVSLKAFHAQRRELLRTLEAPPVKDWVRSAMVNAREETVLSYVSRIVQHEGVHMEQLEETFQPK